MPWQHRFGFKGTLMGLNGEAWQRRRRTPSRPGGYLAPAVIYNGGSRSEAATTDVVGLQVIRDWGVRFNREVLPGLLDRKAPSAAQRLNEEQRRALVLAPVDKQAEALSAAWAT